MTSSSSTKILVTGSNGFIGKNLIFQAKERLNFEIDTFTRKNSDKTLKEKLLKADFLIHLAGENRPETDDQFQIVNVGLTKKISEILLQYSHQIPIVFTSSSQAEISNEYGKSKLAAENILQNLAIENGNPINIYRLPGVFGKWCLPNYNSVVATFCYNIANNLTIKINDEQKIIRLVYIDDVINSIFEVILNNKEGTNFHNIDNEYEITLGKLANKIEAFKYSRQSLIIDKVGTGLTRALYSTYLSYLSVDDFSYSVDSHKDDRGNFVEMLKTKDSGQISYFTAHPGITRGGHYHHTKSEKFLVLNI